MKHLNNKEKLMLGADFAVSIVGSLLSSYLTSKSFDQSYIYVIRSGDYTKIGNSLDPIKRTREIRSQIGEAHLIYAQLVPNIKWSEQRVHNYFKSKIVQDFTGQMKWFDVDPYEVSRYLETNEQVLDVIADEVQGSSKLATIANAFEGITNTINFLSEKLIYSMNNYNNEQYRSK